MQNIRVATRRSKDVGILDIGGDVTSTSEEILESAYEKVSSDDCKKIGLNFEGVSYINSAGMAIIIGILTSSRSRGQTLISWGLTAHFQKIFDMVGITKYMRHVNGEAEALESF